MKCSPCTDESIKNNQGSENVPDAFTMTPHIQVANVGGTASALIVALPVCYQCRIDQQSVRSGLVVA